MDEYVPNYVRTTEPSSRPVPRPRKNRISSATAGPGSHPHQPQPVESLGFSPRSQSDDELDDRNLYADPPPSSSSSSSFASVTSPGMYSGYKGPSSSPGNYTMPQSAYIAPAVPRQLGYLNRSVPSSDTSPGTIALTSRTLPSETNTLQREIELSMERLTESKMKLVEEVGQLRTQRDYFTQEISELKGQKDSYQREMNEELGRLQNEEKMLKVRNAQLQQNIGLMEQMSMQGQRMSGQNAEQERDLKIREEHLKEFEYELKEKETRLAKRSLELQSEADILFQRKKELDIREYDVQNMSSGMPNPAQQQQEMEIFRQQDQELRQREMSLASKELELKKKEKDLQKWEENVKMEDKRAQDNTQRAREMWAESMQLKKEVEGMMAAQELQAKEGLSSSSSVPSVASPISPQPAPMAGAQKAALPVASSQLQTGSSRTAGAFAYQDSSDGGAPPRFAPPSAPTAQRPAQAPDVSQDEMYARHLAMELNRERYDRDHQMALKMLEEERANQSKTGDDDSDYYTHLLLQEQMQDLGMSDFPDAAGFDTSTLKKKLTETLEKQQKEKDEQLKRDEELAQRMQEEINQSNLTSP